MRKIIWFKRLSSSFALILKLVAWLTIKEELIDLHNKIKKLKQQNEFVLNEKLFAALIAGEDHRFLYHQGVDPIAIVRAFLRTFRGKKQGGSTIEQQFVRTLTNDYRPCLSRKFKEILLAATINKLLKKHEIATLYLSIAYFGYRIKGINSACLKLNITPKSSIEQYCQLITHLKYPLKKVFCPRHHMKCEIRNSHIKSNLIRQKCWLSIYDPSGQLDLENYKSIIHSPINQISST